MGTKSIMQRYYASHPELYHAIEGDLLERLQEVEFEMLLDLNRICAGEGIALRLAGGTLLGARRHGGFIPWDDDVDVAILRKDVARFVEIVSRDHGDRYCVQYGNSNTCCAHIKVRKNGTKFVEVGEHGDEDNQGVFVDVFIVENVPDNPLARVLFGIACDARTYIAGSVLAMEGSTPELRHALKADPDAYRNHQLRRLVGRAFSWRRAAEWYAGNLRFFARYSEKKTKQVSVIGGSRHYFGEMFPREMYERCTKITFTSADFYTLSDVDGYLRRIYGPNYLYIPPVEDRQHHYVSEVSL